MRLRLRHYKGYTKGYVEGHNDGLIVGGEKGYEVGYKDGYIDCFTLKKPNTDRYKDSRVDQISKRFSIDESGIPGYRNRHASINDVMNGKSDLERNDAIQGRLTGSLALENSMVSTSRLEPMHDPNFTMSKPFMVNSN